MPEETDLTTQEAQTEVPKQDQTLEPSNSQALLMKLALKELSSSRDALLDEIKEMTTRKKELEAELKISFVGQSDAIARRVKGFQEYLGGALQDLVHSVESLDLVVQPMVVKPSPLDQQSKESDKPKTNEEYNSSRATALSETFKPDERLIRDALDRFLKHPDVYADPWNLRRSLDTRDTDLLEDWFFNQGGRGAQPSRGNRPRNILASAAIIAIVGELYGDQFQCLVLASSPERLGEWRRGLQDALGLAREDFGPNSGIALFERPEALVERADRLEEQNEVPLIFIDAAERSVDIPILQFPLWLAFAASAGESFEDENLI